MNNFHIISTVNKATLLSIKNSFYHKNIVKKIFKVLFITIKTYFYFKIDTLLKM